MAKSKSPIQRMEIPYFEGVNAFVGAHIAKKYEFSHAENARSNNIGSVEKRRGTIAIGSNLNVEANLALIYFENDDADSNGLFLVAEDAGQGRLYYYNTDTEQWTSLVTNLAYDIPYDYTIAEGNLFISNGDDNLFYIDQDLNVHTAATSPNYSNQVIRSPKAAKINYYKDRLYVADYNYGSNPVRNGIGFSSYAMGLISLVTEDRPVGQQEIYVTDTTYIFGAVNDTVEIYRGGKLKGEFNVDGKTENNIVVILPASDFEVLASDEIWIKGTYGDAPKVFRWPDTFGGKSPTEQKTYDTFRLTGEQNGRMTMMVNVGDVMVYANRDNMGIWNDHYAKALDLGIGCSSDYGFVKCLGTLWFIDYNGIYATTGGLPVLKSAKVEPYIKGATKEGLETAAAGKKGYSVFFAIGDVTLYNDDGSARENLENVVLEYNLRQENWYVHTGINAKQFAAYKSDDETELLAFTDGGNAGRYVYEFLNKDRFVDSTPGGDREIPFRVDTTNMTLSKTFETICYPKEIVAEATRGSAMVTYISLDNSPFYELSGNIVKGCVTIGIDERDRKIETIPRCRQAMVSIRDYTKKPCKLTRMAVHYLETDESEEERISQGESINVS